MRIKNWRRLQQVGRKERQAKKRERIERLWQQRRQRRARIEKYAKDILESYNFRRSGKFMQHGRISVKKHSLRVAECSIIIEEKLRKLGIRCQERDMVRGALLHDYFLYDWHDKYSHEKLHGFHHPYVALQNAKREYPLSLREQDIIAKHMWPLTLKCPMCREAWIVTAADKYCSLKETLFCRGKA